MKNIICYLPGLNKVRIFLAIVLLMSTSVSLAGGKPKFTYAELIYQRLYGEDKFLVYGKTVEETIKKAIPQLKYREDALEIMGAEGWELSSTLTREVTGGYEIFYYFKKSVE